MTTRRDRQMVWALIAHAAGRYLDDRAALLDYLEVLDDADLRVAAAIMAQSLADGVVRRFLVDHPALTRAEAYAEIAASASRLALETVTEDA